MLSRLKGIETQHFRSNREVVQCVHTCFPVWRELKLKIRTINATRINVISSHVLSSLKGIETGFNFQIVHRTFTFTRAFPFEGNWNDIDYTIENLETLFVHTCFPVWRELKPAWVRTMPMYFRSILEKMFTRAFPFEGNWNFLRHSVRLFESIPFTRAFPFEGNWN